MADCVDKTRWESERRARHAARVVSSEGGEQMRAYACPYCGGWHITTSLFQPYPRGDKPRPKTHARRLAKGQSIEDLAAQIRAERLEG